MKDTSFNGVRIEQRAVRRHGEMTLENVPTTLCTQADISNDHQVSPQYTSSQVLKSRSDMVKTLILTSKKPTRRKFSDAPEAARMRAVARTLIFSVRGDSANAPTVDSASAVLRAKIVTKITGPVRVPVGLCFQHPGDRIKEFVAVRASQTIWQLKRHTEGVEMWVKVRKAVRRVLDNSTRWRCGIRGGVGIRGIVHNHRVQLLSATNLRLSPSPRTIEHYTHAHSTANDQTKWIIHHAITIPPLTLLLLLLLIVLLVVVIEHRRHTRIAERRRLRHAVEAAST